MDNKEYLKGIYTKIPKEEARKFYIKIPKDYFNKFYELKELRKIHTNGILFCNILEAELRREKKREKDKEKDKEKKDPLKEKGLIQTIAEKEAIVFYLSVPKYYFQKFRELRKIRKIRTAGLFFCHLLDCELKRERRRIKDKEKQEKERQQKQEKKGE